MLRYWDKSRGREVVLRPSEDAFIAIPSEDEAEASGAITAVAAARPFTVVNVSAEGMVFFRVGEGEAVRGEVGDALARLRSSPAVSAVVPALIDESGQTRVAVPGSVVLRLQASAKIRAFERFVKAEGGRIVRRYQSGRLVAVMLSPERDEGDFIAKANLRGDVAFAEPDYLGVGDSEVRISVAGGSPPGGPQPASEPGLPGTGVPLPWNLAIISASDAWQSSVGDRAVAVAIVDGEPVDHPSYRGRLLWPGDRADGMFTTAVTDPAHATALASLAVGSVEAAQGVAPACRIVPLVVDLQMQRYAERAEAISFLAGAVGDGRLAALGLERVVLGCSWRTSGDIASVRTALIDAVTAGIVVVCSAGNDGSQAAHYPSEYSREPGILGESLICVAATDEADRKASYSNYSPAVDLCAPGGDGYPLDAHDVACAAADGGSTYAAGTSFAVPHVCGVVALLLSRYRQLQPAAVKAVLRRSADDISGSNPAYAELLGAGRVNAARALSLAALVDAGGPPEGPPIGAAESESSAVPHQPRVQIVMRGALTTSQLATLRDIAGELAAVVAAGRQWRIRSIDFENQDSQCRVRLGTE